jgi:hypothetical protein
LGVRIAKCSENATTGLNRHTLFDMRAEIQTIVAEIKQSVGLLRRHL